MARTSFEVIAIIEQTASAIASSNDYQWGHMGACNCGFLAQQVTHLKKSEIHKRAMEGYGDWNEQLNDYCPTSGLPMDELISNLLGAGFDIDDLKHLEKLSDPEVLRILPLNARNLRHNVKSDVTTYLRAWAFLLREKIAERVRLPKELTSMLMEA